MNVLKAAIVFPFEAVYMAKLIMVFGWLWLLVLSLLG